MVQLIKDIYFVAYLITNLFAISLLYTAWKRPKIARFLFFIMFSLACCINWNIAIHTPQDYLLYSDTAISKLYSDFITGWFSTHILLVIGFIATSQAFIAISLLLKGLVYKIGAAGGIIFLLSIIPLGIGSALPGPLVMATALMLLYKQGHEFLWVHTRYKKFFFSAD